MNFLKDTLNNLGSSFTPFNISNADFIDIFF